MMTKTSDWNARDYAAFSTAQQEWARELIDKLRLRGDEVLLDIGCGDGRATALIAERLPEGSILGVDNSASMIALATEQFPPAAAPSGPAAPAAPSAHPNLSFRLMDAARLELPRAFDVAFSNAALHWVRDHEAMLRGVRGCLLPGGRLLFQMGGRGNAAEVGVVVDEVVARPRWRGSFDGFTSPYHFACPEDYEEWLPRAGFRVRRAELLPKVMRHADREAFLGWLRTTWFPYTDRLPAELRDAFLGDVAAAYTAAHAPDSAGVVHLRMVRLEVEAEVAEDVSSPSV
jgi:trans-aconitate 2-methyltransferase